MHAQSQASRAAGASASWADAPPVGAWKCRRRAVVDRGSIALGDMWCNTTGEL
ncbi:MAG: hypothetical protein U9N46_00205 [Euryarchaeota archaeon]|nr:hypothetical protein [Euryarchaeota archaeon]